MATLNALIPSGFSVDGAELDENTIWIDLTAGTASNTAICGIESHYKQDGKVHGIPASDCMHTYTCECDGWMVPLGCTYYTGITTTTVGNYSSATKVYQSGEKLPCGYEPTYRDVLVPPDYEYRFGHYSQVTSWQSSDIRGWGVRCLDTTKKSYGKIFDNIVGKPLVFMTNAFKGCSAMEVAPQIPKTTIRFAETFAGCSSLTKAPSIPSGVTHMGGTFNGCTKLQTYVGNLGSIGDMSGYKIPNTVTTMHGAFSGCSSIVYAPEIPEGVISIQSTFDHCSSLVAAPTIPNSVINMYGAFSWCTSLTKAPNLENLTNLENMAYTFNYCTALTDAPVIPACVTNMEGTFHKCSALAGNVTIHANPTNYHKCFQGLDLRTKITLSGNSEILDLIKTTGWIY